MINLTNNSSRLATQLTDTSLSTLSTSLQEKYNKFLKNYKIKLDEDTNQIMANGTKSKIKFPTIRQDINSKKLPQRRKYTIQNVKIKSVIQKKRQKVNKLQIQHTQIEDKYQNKHINEIQQDFLRQIDNSILRKTNIMLNSRKNSILSIKIPNNLINQEKQGFKPQEQYQKILKRFKIKIQKEVQDIQLAILKDKSVDSCKKQTKDKRKNKFIFLKSCKNDLKESSINYDIESSNYIPQMFNHLIRSKISLKREDLEGKFLSTANKDRVKRILIMTMKKLRSKKLNQQNFSTLMCSLPSIL